MSKYSKKKRLSCLLLCAVPFTGLLGGHRFYLGRIKSGFLYILLVFLAFGSESNDSSFSNFIGYTIVAFWLVDLTRIIFFGLKDDQGSLVPPYLDIPKLFRFIGSKISSKPSFEKFKSWWKLDTELEKNSADNPLTALSEQQRRNAGPLLALAFGWGFLVTGLFTGGLLGNGLPF